MSSEKSNISDTAIEALARSFIKEAKSYGFEQIDFVRFVNVFLDHSMTKTKKDNSTETIKPGRINYNSIESVNPPLEGENIKIRLMNHSSDRKLLEEWQCDEKGRKFLLSRTTAYKMSVKELVEDDTNIIGIITLKDNTPVGAAAFLNYDNKHSKAELRKLIGNPDYRGKGYAKEAIKLWINYGFGFLKLNKIYLNTFNTNIRNIRLNEELGFRVEGVLRNEVFVDNEYKDVLRMGLWRE